MLTAPLANRENARQFWHFRKPAAVFLLLALEAELHRSVLLIESIERFQVRRDMLLQHAPAHRNAEPICLALGVPL